VLHISCFSQWYFSRECSRFIQRSAIPENISIMKHRRRAGIQGIFSTLVLPRWNSNSRATTDVRRTRRSQHSPRRSLHPPPTQPVRANQGKGLYMPSTGLPGTWMYGKSFGSNRQGFGANDESVREVSHGRRQTRYSMLCNHVQPSISPDELPPRNAR
jgi:hypothetical protein